MNFDLLFAIIFYGVLLILFFKYRERFQVQGKILAIYRTSLGIKLMDKIAKRFPKTLNFIGNVGIFAGFIGMAVICYVLIKGTIQLVLVPKAAPAVAPLLPGVKVAGLPVLSFWHWIIGIFIIAVVHEMMHGVFARLYNTKVKSSGFIFLGPILGAFVEPDEKELVKKTKRQQIAVFAAGPFSNLVLGAIFLLIFSFITGPIYSGMYDGDGIKVNKLLEDYPAEKAGIEVPFVIKEINGKSTFDTGGFLNATGDIKPNQKIILETDKGDYELVTVENPDNKSRGFIGITDFTLNTKLKSSVIERYGETLPNIYEWFNMLIFWLVVINVGVGLFNLLPLGPVDGGRMLLTGLSGLLKNDIKAKKIWTFISFFFLFLIFVNLFPYLWKLLLFILKPFVFVLGL